MEASELLFVFRSYLPIHLENLIACLIYVLFVFCFVLFLRIVVANTCCVVFSFCFSLSCVPYVSSFSGLLLFDCPFGILWRLFVLCLVYPMFPVSLDFSVLTAHSVFSNVCLSCVLCALCFQFLWIVHFWLPLWYSLTFICPVSCLPYVSSFSGLSIFDCPFGIL